MCSISFDKILITGPPRSGKTTLAQQHSHPNTIHTDDYKYLSWQAQLQILRLKADELDSWLIEGIQGPRLLRKGLEPDLVIWLSKPHQLLTKKQSALAKGMEKIFKEWLKNKPQHVEVRYEF